MSGAAARRGVRVIALALAACLAAAQAPAQTASGPPAPESGPAPVPGRNGVLPPPRHVVPDHSFAPLRPEPGDIWSEVQSWSRPEARRAAAGPLPPTAGQGARPPEAAGEAPQASAQPRPATPSRRRGRASRPAAAPAAAAAAPRASADATPAAPPARPQAGKPGAGKPRKPRGGTSQ